jgi:nitroimidazol reductase NimA-like FMN-containing flavoprotein (pyridoxamine 5'-phosphate oxidase superfamily)
MSVKDMQKFMSAASMSEKEIQEFLSIPRLARMATIQNGKPHLVPVWYFYDGTNIIVSTPKRPKKTKNLQSNPNVSIIIDIVDGRVEDLSYATKAKAVIIEGIAELQDDTDSSFARKTYERYVGKNALNNPQVQFSVNLPRYTVVIKPTKIMSWDFTKIEASKQ